MTTRVATKAGHVVDNDTEFFWRQNRKKCERNPNSKIRISVCFSHDRDIIESWIGRVRRGASATTNQQSIKAHGRTDRPSTAHRFVAQHIMPGTMMMVWRVTTMTLLLLRYRSCLAWTTTWKYSGLSRHGQCRSTTNLRRKLSSLPSLSSSLAMVRRGEAPPSHLRKQNEHPPRNYRLISSEVVSKEGLRSTKSECGDDRWEQEALEECFVDCWNATYWTVNQYKDPAIDTILQRLCSPAPQGFYIIQRAVQHEMAARRAANRKGGSLGSVLGSLVYLLKQGHVFAIRND